MGYGHTNLEKTWFGGLDWWFWGTTVAWSILEFGYTVNGSLDHCHWEFEIRIWIVLFYLSPDVAKSLGEWILIRALSMGQTKWWCRRKHFGGRYIAPRICREYDMNNPLLTESHDFLCFFRGGDDLVLSKLKRRESRPGRIQYLSISRESAAWGWSGLRE